VLHQPFAVEFTIQNMTLHLADLAAIVDSADGFAFSGYKQSCFKILPLGRHTFNLNFLPLKCGRIHLPRVRILKRSDISISSDGTVNLSKQDEKNCFKIFVPSQNQSSSEISVIVLPKLF
jgi:hypothetical protein